MDINPYAVDSDQKLSKGVFGNARRRRGGFLFRLIDVDAPVQLTVRYSGWWFVQRVRVNQKLCWWKISWLRIERHIEFGLPPDIDAQRRRLELDITLSPSLWIGRFQIRLGDQTVYDEIS